MKNQLRLLPFVMLLFALTKVTSQCEITGYNYAGTYNGHFYYVSVENSDWITANANANALGGYLATISDAAENTFVSGIATTWATDFDYYGYFRSEAWIGLNDMAIEGAFVWSNGEPVTYTNWEIYEPNNSGGNEDWVQINYGYSGKWNDFPGSTSFEVESIVEFEDVFNDTDCDGIDDPCDSCPGGDDSGPCDAESFPGFENIPAGWVCHAGGRKVLICHEGTTLCINYNAVQDHLDHGDFLGPCVGCAEGRKVYSPITDVATGESLDRPDFAISPNPGIGDFTITMQKHSGLVRIYDQRGQLIRSVEGVEHQKLNIYLQDEGVYIIQLTTNNETVTKKLFVVR